MPTSNQSIQLFQELAQIFAQRTKENQAIEFEILEPAHALTLGPLIQDDHFVGISKKALIQIFAVARPLFFDTLVSMTDKDMLLWSDFGSITGENNKTVVPASDVISNVPLSVVSEIILLFDCEHVTACNWRKRRVLSFLGDSALTNVNQVLETELTLMTTYTCSLLHRHTKSPTLWQHRLWTWVQLISLRKRSLDVQGILLEELMVVLRAGELHPRNYYAFAYLRRLYGVFVDNMIDDDEVIHEKENSAAARSMLNPTLDWCLSHPQDISGWTFTLWLLDQLHDQDARVASIEQVVHFALNLGWEGESLWTFVDLAARSFGLVERIQADSALRGGGATDQLDGTWKLWLSRARAYWGSAVK